MVHVLVVLSHVRETTFSYELSERLAALDELEVTIVSYFDRTLEEAATVADGSAEIVPLGATSRFDPAAIRGLRWHLANAEYDLLHTHHNLVGSLARALAPRGTTIVDTEHADHKRHYSPAQVLVNAPTLPRADRIVANSEQTLRSLYWFERLPPSPERFDVIYNGVDLTRLDAALEAPREHLDPTDRRITSVGRFSETKNHATLLRAFAHLRADVPDVQLTLVGDGPLREALESLARSLGVRDAVEFTGFVDREAVYRTLATSELYVHPATSEGFCMAVVEAMACRVPVVVGDLEVFHEVVGDAGRFVAPTDPLAFADRMRGLLEDDERRASLADRGFDRARREFPLEKTVEAYASLYASVLAE
jgi:L-malate glycosyltransferase